MNTVIAIANQKGGVAKTTSTMNLSHALTARGAKVLCIDADPQGDLTDYFGFDQDALEEQEQTLYFALLGEKPLSALVIGENPYLIPSSIALADAEPELMSDQFRSAPTVLRDKLREIRNAYDIILIDCMPSLSLVTVNALAAADGVLIPIKTDRLSYRGFQRLLATIDKVHTRLNPELTIIGVLPTVHNPQYSHDKGTLERMQAELARSGVRLFPAINRSTHFDRGMEEHAATLTFAPDTPGAQVYAVIAEELLK
jgi:chromosome partitioning protein